MKFDLRAMALAGGLFWGVAILMLALANLAWPGYGRAVLEWSASVYPGYHPGSGFGSVLIGAAYAFVDGAVAGALFGWLYNRFAHPHVGRAA
jgi:hypothetical protein